MKRIISAIMFLSLVGFAFSVQAVGDVIRFTQGTSGTLSAVLAGFVDPCKGSFVFPIEVSSVTLNGSEYDINSSFAILDPPPCPDIPQPYELIASLGHVADGHYVVVWTTGPMIVRGAFDVRSGLLLTAATNVPTLTLPALSALVAMIAVVGLALLQRERRS